MILWWNIKLNINDSSQPYQRNKLLYSNDEDEDCHPNSQQFSGDVVQFIW